MSESSETAAATGNDSSSSAPPEPTAPSGGSSARPRKAPAHRAAPATRRPVPAAPVFSDSSSGAGSAAAPARKGPAKKVPPAVPPAAPVEVDAGAPAGTAAAPAKKAPARKAPAKAAAPAPAKKAPARKVPAAKKAPAKKTPVAPPAPEPQAETLFTGPAPVPVVEEPVVAEPAVTEPAPEVVETPAVAVTPEPTPTPAPEPAPVVESAPVVEPAPEPAPEPVPEPAVAVHATVVPPASVPAERPAFAAVDAVEVGAGPVKRLSGTPKTVPTLVRAALPFGRKGKKVPGTVLRLDGVKSSPEAVADYVAVCGGALGGTLPALYPHMLGFPLQMTLMGDRKFPFPAIGLVHVTNDAVQRTPIPIGAAVDVEVHAEGPVPHKRGVTIDMVTRVMLDGELAWFSTSTYLRRGHSELPKDESPKEPKEDAAPLPQRSIWRVPADQGRQYAAVSGDANPIHMSGLSAKAFGFPSAIAHGMWTAAKVASASENLRGDVWRQQVQFRAPILLPSTVTYHEARQADGDLAFEVRGKRDRLHLTGTFS